MRELDTLLERYLSQDYGQAPDDEKTAFRQLLTLSDPDLAGYLLHGEHSDDDRLANVIARIHSSAHP